MLDISAMMQRLDQMLLDVAQRVPGFKHSKEEVVRVLKEVAEYKAPGVYILTDYVRKRELAPMLLASEPGSPPRDATPGAWLHLTAYDSYESLSR